MKARILAICALTAAALLGCGGPDAGSAPPPTKPVTEQDLSSMPPQAAAQVRSMQKYGSAQQSAMAAAAQARNGANH